MEDLVNFITAIAFLFGLAIGVYAVGFLFWNGVKRFISWINNNESDSDES